MVSNNFAVYGITVIIELVRDVIFFPFWWYSKGLIVILKDLAQWLAGREKSLALLVWIKNIHKPMYGQTDWQGMIISFFIRLIEIVARSAIMLVWTMIALIVLLFWLSLPVFTVYQIIFQVLP